MIDTHADPAIVGGKIVDPVRGHFAQFLVREVLRLDSARLTAWFPLPAGSPVISYDFLLLGIDRDHGLTTALERADFAVDVLELVVAVGVILPFLGLAIGLQAIAHRDQDPAHSLVAQVMPQLGESVG